MNHRPIAIKIEEVCDPDEQGQATERREQFDSNSAWLQANIRAIYNQHRGKCICVAGQEAFVGDTVSDAIAKATSAHPNDKGWFTRYIPKEKAARIYAV